MTSISSAATQIVHFTLENGLEVVVIPDHRAPVVTHMIWYRNGAADDPPGKSGIAHFLEHLMFKGTKAHPKGAFSEFISEVGGQENAFTGNDFTAYFQQVAKEHLRACMDFEADRMTGLVLTDEIVAPERDVVLEERRMHCDTDPGAQLGEAVQATLFTHHPYGIPIIGWGHEIEGLKREDALAYYQRFYTPENAILVVAGDVEPEEARALAEETYGKVKPRGAKPERIRSLEPPTVASRLVTVADDEGRAAELAAPLSRPVLPHRGAGRIGGARSARPSARRRPDEPALPDAGDRGEARGLGLGLLSRHGARRDPVHRQPDARARRQPRDARQGLRPGAGDLPERGDRAGALERAKTRLVADAIYARDSQSDLARWYGSSLAIGQTLKDVEDWPAKIDAVEAEAVIAAARRWLDRKPAVTGHLLPLEAEAA